MIVDEAVKRILEMVDLEEGGQSQDPLGKDGDAGTSIQIPDQMVRVIQSMNPHPEVVKNEGDDILGLYRPMSSPGQITLRWDSIGSLFWHTVLDMQRQPLYMERRDLEPMATLVVQKTYVHEGFHHFADVARRLFGGQYDRDREEALAVACSHR